MHQDQSIQLFTEIFHKITRDWRNFIAELKESAEIDDRGQIFFEDFLKVCGRFNIKLSESQKLNLLYSFPGRDEGNKKRLNISRIYD